MSWRWLLRPICWMIGHDIETSEVGCEHGTDLGCYIDWCRRCGWQES